MKKAITTLFILALALLSFPNISLASFSFAVIGDSRGSISGRTGLLKTAVTQIAQKTDGPIFPMGDEVNSCKGDLKCKRDFQHWRSLWGKIISRNYSVVGNHDRSNSGSDKTWQDLFPLPENGPAGFKRLTYSYDYGDGHFVVLDSEKPAEHVINKVQRDWLDKDLDKTNKTYTFVFYHEPAFNISRDNDGLVMDKDQRDAFWKIIDKHNVTAVFNGHEHLYGRKKITSKVFPGEKNTIYQITVGNTDVNQADTPKSGLSDYAYKGKSFLIVTVNNHKITLNLYSLFGKLINSYTFTK